MRKVLWCVLLSAMLGVLAMPLWAEKPGKNDNGPTFPSPTNLNAATPFAATRPSKEEIERLKKLQQATTQAVGLFQAGKFDQAKKQLLVMVKDYPDDETCWYNLACAQSRLGQKDDAFKSLDTAITNGFSDFLHLQRDEDLTGLHKSPQWKQLLERREQAQLERAKKISEVLKKNYGEDYIVEVAPKEGLVMATNVDRTTLDALKARLTQQAGALWNDLFDHKFEQYVTVIIPRTDSKDMDGVGGYYMQGDRILVAKTVGMTVHHEFTHALHAADMEYLNQEHPVWVSEGLATLYESSEIRDGHITPTPNQRLNTLQTLLARKRTMPWKDLMQCDQEKFMKRAGVSYCQARYMMMFLYDQGVLRKWYHRYTETFKDDPSGIKAMEDTFHKKLSDVEAMWVDWVKKLPSPPLSLPANHAYIGIRVEPETDGLEIAEIVPGSGADHAGLATKDVIVNIDGRDMVDPGDLIMLVDGHKVGDKLKVKYRRDGRYETATVTLGAMDASKRASGGPRRQPATASQPPARKAG